jgi:dethiobiotin synthetase
LARICPQSFAVPAAPPIAASLEGKRVDESLLIAGAQWWQGQCEFLIVEGVGGAMSPISETLTVLDLASELQLPVIVIAANRLGVVSHVLLVIEALAARHLPIAGIVLNELPASQQTRELEREARSTNSELIRRFWETKNYAPVDLRIVETIQSLF